MTTPTSDTEIAESPSPWGFGAGLLVGALLTLSALGIGVPAGTDAALVSGVEAKGAMEWIALNLGHSFWFFALVLALYLMNLQQLSRLLRTDPHSLRVTELDQLSDVWMHLFVGIGVIWTAVGMRSALQAALGDASVAGGVVDSADTVLRKLVDGGILLALTTTIVGGVGGYLMRLGKTVLLGSRLQALFEQQQRSDVQALVAATERIESRLLDAQQKDRSSNPETAPEHHASAH